MFCIRHLASLAVWDDQHEITAIRAHPGFDSRPVQEITLPERKRAVLTKEEEAMKDSTLKFEEFMRNSCYHLELDAPKKKNDDKEIKRFSDRKCKTYSKREPLKSYLKLTPGNFPAELLDGFKHLQPSNKKCRWDKISDEKAFEVFEKLEENHNKEGENKAEKDGEEEDVEDEEEVEEEESSDDDYNQNIEFDDDDDDWNQQEEAGEDCYE